MCAIETYFKSNPEFTNPSAYSWLELQYLSLYPCFHYTFNTTQKWCSYLVTVLSCLIICVTFYVCACVWLFLFFNATLKSSQNIPSLSWCSYLRPKQGQDSPVEVYSVEQYRIWNTSFSELSILSLKLGYKFWTLQNYNTAQFQAHSLAKFHNCYPNISTFHILTFSFSLCPPS